MQPSRKHMLALLLPTLLGACLRVGFFLETRASDPLYGRPLLDAAFYDAQAHRILACGFRLDEPFLLAPLYSYFLAAIYGLAGSDPGPVLLLQALLGTASVALGAALGGRLCVRWDLPSLGALVAGLAIAVNPFLILYDARLLPVTLTVFLLTLFSLLLDTLWRRGARGVTGVALAMLGGLVLGTATLARPNLLLVAPLLVALLLGRGLRTRAPPWQRLAPAVLLGLGFCLPPTLSALHNLRSGGDFTPVSQNGGFNLYMGNNARVGLRAELPFHMPGRLPEVARKARLVASIESDTWLDEQEADRWWRAKALAEIREAPLRTLGLLGRKLHQFFGPREYFDNEDTVQTASQSRWLRPWPSTWALLSALALAALLLRLPSPPPAASPQPDADAGRDWHLLLLLGACAASTAIFFVVDRYRLPVLPLLAALGASTLARLVRDISSRRLRALPGILAVMAVLALLYVPQDALLLPWNRLADARKAGTEPECPIRRPTQRGYESDRLFLVATSQIESGEPRQAFLTLKDLLERDPAHPLAWTSLSYLLLDANRPEEAATAARTALSLDRCSEKAWANLATASLRLSRWEEAVAAAERAAELEPYEMSYLSTLGEAYLHVDQFEAARACLLKARRWDPEAWRPLAALAQLAFREQAWEDARRWSRAALNLEPKRGALWAMLGAAELALGNPNETALLLKRARDGGIRDPALDLLASRMLSAVKSMPGNER